MDEKTKKVKGVGDNRFMKWIERVGDKFPDSYTLFLYLIGIVVILSFILNKLGITAIHPSSGEIIAVNNLLSINGLVGFMTNFIKNYQTFPVLAVVIILGISTGICNESGFFKSALTMALEKVKGNAVVFIIAFIGVIANNAADVAFILIPMLAGIVFLGMGRHPLAGLFLGYASVGGGYTTSIIPGAWEAILHPMTIDAAQTLDPSFDMPMLSSYFILAIAAILIVIASSLVTIYIIEPMLGEYKPKNKQNTAMEVTDEEKKAVKKCIKVIGVFLLLVVLACIPKSSFMRGPTGSLAINAPLMSSLQFIIIVVFLLAGFIYAKETKQINSISDAVKLMEKAALSLVPFLILATVISQFLYFFNISNIGAIIAIRGGESLSRLPVPKSLIIVLFFWFVAILNLFIGSASTKYLLVSPILIPMLMQLNIHPALGQVVYRLGDCVTNNLTPLMPYFAILLTNAKQYDEDATMGTLFSAMVPYSIVYLILYSLLLLLWIAFDIPTGIGGGVFLN